MALPKSLLFVVSYLYVQAVLCPALIINALLTGKHNAFTCGRTICHFMGVKFLRTLDSAELGNGCVFLCNHRCWADFFVDQALCGGAAYLSRLLVIVGVPTSSLYAWLGRSTWYFNRKSGIDRTQFGSFIESLWKLRPDHGLIVYPEGTRNLGDEPKRLKTGVIQYAYEHDHPVQAVVTAGKERVINEKKMSASMNQLVVTHVSPVLHPKDFDNKEDFIAAARKLFTDSWAKAYQDPQGKTELYDPSSMPRVQQLRGSRADRKRLMTLRLIVILIIFLILIYRNPKFIAQALGRVM